MMFSNSEAFRAGWRILKDRVGFLIGVHFVALAVQCAPQLLMGDSPGMKALVVIGSLLLSFVAALGLVRIGLNLVDGQDAEVADLWSCAHLVFKYLVAALLHFSLVVSCPALVIKLGSYFFSLNEFLSHTALAVISCFLLVLLSLYVLILFSLWPYLMVEHELGPIEAMKESSRLTRDTRGNLMLFYMLSLVAILLGAVVLLVGSIVAYALITVAGAFVYRQIQANQPEHAGVLT
jgi:hypothetical protein